MRLHCSWAVFLLSFVLVVCIPNWGLSQTVSPGSEASSDHRLKTLDRSQVIERRFRSSQPRPRPQWDFAVSGAEIMKLHEQRAAAATARSLAPAPVNPLGGTYSGTLPGIQMRAPSAGGEYPTSVVTGDFNKDGHLDYAVANGTTSDIWIYLGKGDGTFQLPRIVPLNKGLSPVYLVTADLRGNGTLDLIVAEYDTCTVGVLPGNGDGTFGYERTYALPEPPGALAIADFNHDGKLDIAAAMSAEYYTATFPFIALINGNGDGTFNAPTIAYSGLSAYVLNADSADVNGDGLPDLLITGLDANGSSVYLNNGDGTFKNGSTIVTYSPLTIPVDGRFADVNGDGCPDAIVADGNTYVWLSMGDCTGSFPSTNFTSPHIKMGDSNAALRIADINGDGHLDLVTSSEYLQGTDGGYSLANSVNVALGDGHGNFGTARIYPGVSEAYSLAVGSFKDHGLPDVVTADIDTDTTTVFTNDGSGSFGFPQGIFGGISSTGESIVAPNYPTLVDLNRDGKTDLFQLGGANSGLVSIANLNDGTGRFSTSLVSVAGVQLPSGTFGWTDLGDYRLGDFRGTGHLDVVAIGVDGASSAPQLILFQPGNGDGTFGTGTVTNVTGAGGLMTTGDFNGDGKLDFVAVTSGQTEKLTAFLGNGDGTFKTGGSVSFANNGTQAFRVYTGDFNHDGKADVFVFDSTNAYWTTQSSVWEFLGNGDGTFQSGRQLFTGFQPLALGDLNGDGRPDIARYDFKWPDGTTTAAGPARFTIYLGQLDGSFVQSSTYAPYDGVPREVEPMIEFGDPAGSSLTGDYNADGKPEEVAFQTGIDNYAQMLIGNGDGTFIPTYDVFEFSSHLFPWWAGKLDASGYSSLLLMDHESFGMSVFKGGPAPTLQIGLAQEVVTGNSGCGTVFPDLVSSSDRTVTLSSSIAGVVLPGSVVIPANATSAPFCFTLASSLDWHRVFDINAQLDGGTATAYASSSYSLGFKEDLSTSSPAPVYGGQSTAPFTLTLTGNIGYTSTAKLSCAGLPTSYSCTFGSDTLHVAPGVPVSTTVVVNTGAVASASTIYVMLVADDGNVIQRQTVPVYVGTLAISGDSALQTTSPGSNSMNVYVNGIPPYSLGCSGLPAGSTCSFSGTQTSYPSQSQITVTVNAPSGLSAADTPFLVTVSSGGNSASTAATLKVFSFTVQAPSAETAWALAGSSQNVTFPVVVSNLAAGTLTLSCSLTISATCPNLTWHVASGTAHDWVTVNIPAGTPAGQYQMTVTASLNGATQTYTFPFYVASFSGSLSTGSLSIKNLATGTMNVTLNATVGLNATLTLGCGNLSALHCSFSPASVQLVGGTPQTATLTITSTGIAFNRGPRRVFDIRSGLLLASLLPLSLLLLRRRFNCAAFFTAVIAAASLALLASCGSGGSASSTGGGGSGGGGSQSQSYVLTVTASPVNTSLTQTLGTVTVTVTQ